MQKATFYIVKGSLLQCEKRSFATRKATFCKPVVTRCPSTAYVVGNGYAQSILVEGYPGAFYEG